MNAGRFTPLTAVCVVPLLILYSMRRMPEVASVAVSATVGEFVQPAGSAVVSAGTVLSTFRVWERQADTLPARSVARVSMSCWPSVETTNVEPAGPLSVALPSRRHSTYSTPEPPASSAETVTVVFAVRQLVGIDVVSIGASVSSPGRLGSTVTVPVRPGAVVARVVLDRGLE